MCGEATLSPGCNVAEWMCVFVSDNIWSARQLGVGRQSGGRAVGGHRQISRKISFPSYAKYLYITKIKMSLAPPTVFMQAYILVD